jgi:hypothetical protein
MSSSVTTFFEAGLDAVPAAGFFEAGSAAAGFAAGFAAVFGAAVFVAGALAAGALALVALLVLEAVVVFAMMSSFQKRDGRSPPQCFVLFNKIISCFVKKRFFSKDAGEKEHEKKLESTT